eukprot:scpid103044/ scgid6835/ 
MAIFIVLVLPHIQRKRQHGTVLLMLIIHLSSADDDAVLEINGLVRRNAKRSSMSPSCEASCQQHWRDATISPLQASRVERTNNKTPLLSVVSKVQKRIVHHYTHIEPHYRPTNLDFDPRLNQLRYWSVSVSVLGVCA